jgi:enterochelin esterase-like enzyme
VPILRRSFTCALLLCLALLGALPAGAGPTPVWLDPDRSEPAGTHYRTFQSAAVHGPASYLVYLPPDYETARERRYPVIYVLHGAGGSPRSGTGFVSRLDAAIRAGKAPPAIAVLANAGHPWCFYCDSLDGRMPVESLLIRDLIPHVDATYRTLAKREHRAIEGMSMGGYGAAHLGLKYPELFGAVSVFAGAIGTFDGVSARVIHDVYGDSRPYFVENAPATLAAKNADALRGKTALRIIVGKADPLRDLNWSLHDTLNRQGLENSYEVVPGVGHAYTPLYDGIGDRIWEFYARAFKGAG